MLKTCVVLQLLVLLVVAVPIFGKQMQATFETKHDKLHSDMERKVLRYGLSMTLM